MIGKDKALFRWSTVLLVLAFVTLLANILGPLSLILDGTDPLVLAKGDDLWKFTLGELKAWDRVVVFTTLVLPSLIWVLGVLQIGQLALLYRGGKVFEQANVRCFLRLGTILVVSGILESLVYPAINHYLFARGISPWLADMKLLFTLEPDLIMAGMFFFVLGKIMQRGVELQEFDRLTV